MRKNIILFGILIALSLSGCGDKGVEMCSSTDVTEEISNLRDGENEEEVASDEPVDDRTNDLTDYSSYLKKYGLRKNGVSTTMIGVIRL